MSKVEVNAKGIKNRLKSVKPYRSISEYIWNGFDADHPDDDSHQQPDDGSEPNFSALPVHGQLLSEAAPTKERLLYMSVL